MNVNADLTILDVLIGAIGLLFVVLAAIEYSRLASLRKDFEGFRQDLRREQHKNQKALQRVIASYGVVDVDERIELLLTAIKTDPSVFNGFNSLGYAYFEKGDIDAAIDAFREAIAQSPDVKEGYIDLATVYARQRKQHLCRKYLDKAIAVDSTAIEDINSNAELRSFLN